MTALDTNELLYSAQPLDTGALVAAAREGLGDLLPELRPELLQRRVGARASTTPLVSQLAAIQRDLAAAEAAMADLRYEGAVEMYETLRRRIYALIVDGGRPRAGVRDIWQPPHDPVDFDRMLEAGIALVSDELAATDHLAIVEAVPRPDVLQAGAKLGLRVDDALTADLAQLERQGRRLLHTGDWEAAARIYRGLAASTQIPRAMRAEFLLNHGAIRIQAGDLPGARTVLQEAAGEFQDVGDELGVAQSTHNLAVASAAAGDEKEADALFKAAEDVAAGALGASGTAVTVAGKLGKLGPGRLAALDARPDRIAGIARMGQPLLDERSLGAADRRARTTVPKRGTLGDLGSGLQLVLRTPGEAAWQSAPLHVAEDAQAPPRQLVAGIVSGQDVVELAWSTEQPLRPVHIREALYQRRRQATTIQELGWSAGGGVDLAVQLPHLYYWLTPLALGDAYRELGNWSAALTWYWLAADYEHLNPAVEAAMLWERIAGTHLLAGDEHYRADRFGDAVAAYAQVVEPGPRAPESQRLYQHEALAGVGSAVAAFVGDPESEAVGVPLGVKAEVLELMQRVVQLDAGLDWLGMPIDAVPPFTFDYLQAVARQFAQQAQAAAREYIQFRQAFDEGRLSKLQLAHAVTDAGNEAALARHQHEVVAAQEVTVAQSARVLSEMRLSHATNAHADYKEMREEQIQLEAELNAISDLPENELSMFHHLPGARRKIATMTKDYELARMAENMIELSAARQHSVAQVDLAEKRREAAGLAAKAAEARQAMAQQLLEAYDQNTFSHAVWRNLARAMERMSRRYLYYATRVARLMARAYAFEYNLPAPVIRTDYADVAVRDTRGFALTAADALLADIDLATFRRITETRHRTLRGTMRVSLAARYPFLLQTEFRRTGQVAFETLLSDVERQWPGSFHHRIQGVEVEVVGLLPLEGVHGTLRNGAIAQYRTVDGEGRWRVQAPDTMLVSAYSPTDALSFRHRPEQLAVFEGAGLASTWIMDIPLATNDIDPGTVVDVVLSFHFEALFDRELEQRVRDEPTPSEALRGSKVFSLRWDFPDRFFLWHSQGATTLAVAPNWFPSHHLDPAVRLVAMQLRGADGAVPPAPPLTLGAPAREPVALSPDDAGQVPSSDPALEVLAGAPVVGEWPLGTDADRDVREQVLDILIFVEYEFTERGES